MANECEHLNFASTVRINRLTNVRMPTGGPVTGYMADIRVQCVDCSEPFRWRCAQHGVDFHGPSVSADGMELRAPLRPASSATEFGPLHSVSPAFSDRDDDPTH